MGIEIERKFLIHPEMLIGLLKDGTGMLQGYLSYEPAVRIRIEYPEQGPLSLLTIKMKGKKREGSAGNLEYNYEVPLSDGMDMYAECGISINKTRFRIGRWEIDQFHEELDGLWVAEIELESGDEAVVLPEWIHREVTDNPQYSNANLVRHGLPTDYLD
jgi:CYTH domain-containing protein